MDSLKDQAAIVGTGETVYSRDSGRIELSMAVEAAKIAIADAGLADSPTRKRRRRRRRRTSGDDAHPPHDRTAREGDPDKQRDESATGPTSADATPSRDGGSQIEGGSKSGKRRRRKRRRRAPRDGGPNRDAPDPS